MSHRDRLIRILQTKGELEGRADDVADAIINEFRFDEQVDYVTGMHRWVGAWKVMKK